MIDKFLNLFKREPDVYIGGKDNPYLLRWHIIPRNPIFNIYLHKFLRDDDDRALHDHPWPSLSFLLKGSYIEHIPVDDKYPAGPTVKVYYREGSVIFRKATHTHRIELPFKLIVETLTKVKIPAWTLFITGPKIREWGFHCPDKFIHWTLFSDPDDPSKKGAGCDQ